MIKIYENFISDLIGVVIIPKEIDILSNWLLTFLDICINKSFFSIATGIIEHEYESDMTIKSTKKSNHRGIAYDVRLLKGSRDYINILYDNKNNTIDIILLFDFSYNHEDLCDFFYEKSKEFNTKSKNNRIIKMSVDNITNYINLLTEYEYLKYLDLIKYNL